MTLSVRAFLYLSHSFSLEHTVRTRTDKLADTRSSDIFNIIHTHGKKERESWWAHRCDDPFLKWELICCTDKHGECVLLVSFQRAYDNARCAIPRREKLTREITRVEITISCIFILYLYFCEAISKKDFFVYLYSFSFLFSSALRLNLLTNLSIDS